MAPLMKPQLVLVASAVVLSLVFSFVIFPRIQESLNLNIDPDKCGELAGNIFEGKGYVYDSSTSPAIDRGPVYPYIVAGMFSAVGSKSVAAVQIFQAMCHGLTCLIMFLVARKLLDEKVALWTGALCAAHPMLIWYTSRLWIETVHTLLVTTAILAIVLVSERVSLKRLAIAGLVLGVTVLTKSVLMLFPFVLGVFLVRQRGLEGLRAALIIIMVSVLVVAPWTYRNYQVSRRFVPVHTSLGLNLIQGDAIGEHWTEMPLSTMALWQKGFEETNAILQGSGATSTDPQGDRLLIGSSLSRSLENPGFLLKKVLINGLTFLYLSESPAKSILLMVIQFPLAVLVLISSFRLWGAHPLSRPIILLIVYFFLTHAFIVGWARYSVPIIPACLLLASTVLVGFRNPARHQPPGH